MRKAILILACLLLTASVVSSQRKRVKPSPKPRTDPYLIPIPNDEVLYDKAEASEILSHKGWRIAARAAEDANKSQDVIYHDEERTVKANGIARAWLKTETQKDGKRVASNMALADYDCQNSRTRRVSQITYDENFTVTDTDSTLGKWHYIAPETIGERVFGVLCKDLEDEEQRDYRLASEWFRDAVRLEKKGELKDASFWYKAALEHAPNNLKIEEAIRRLNSVNAP